MKQLQNDPSSQEDVAEISLFGLGHSNASLSHFVSLLEAHAITVVVDVRSSPRSRFAHFSGTALSRSLAKVSISYAWLGDKLGGRFSPTLTYADVERSDVFATGIAEVLSAARGSRVALMCSEHDACTCHRALLIGRHLKFAGTQMTHITRTGETETQQELEQRLMRMHPAPPLDATDPVASAYAMQERKLFGRKQP
ncbi:hypothetical protein GJW-30_1_00051 [Variibacter gotjawalensis]|uniref:DUF488 domain-containing protein n=1 Tax=Variibacter gotjawalensis TaxID=1333996 RepID=A0A0S3PNQ0_9BRAD|nr:DUF488 domain-containing protein [Variibacter gotjawalensis]NIK47829.1 uncharacterized protein (DUF488 family) [Variibacter gotjawalensis]RZS49716.1 uncharacterized protein DUF488 [Variibacter gotjawalensis]BAT57545.1 hypothetical protein GJW-30_1_00051 [Variibacter gotjawalensis]